MIKDEPAPAVNVLDRLFIGLFSMVLVMLTFAAWFFIFQQRGWRNGPMLELYFDFVFSGRAKYFVYGAGILGFVVGPKMGELFGILWGTSEPDV